jgi:branched-chain amino acid aminotransferase
MSKNIDWSSLGFGYVQRDKRFVSNYKNGAWDDGVLTEDATVNLSECAGVLQYAQTCFEGLKAYTTEKGQIVIFRPDLNASRMADSCKRLEMPVYPEDKWVDAVGRCFLRSRKIHRGNLCGTEHIRAQRHLTGKKSLLLSLL